MCIWALVDSHPFQIRSGPRGWKLYWQRVIQACFFLDLLCSDLMLPVASWDLLLPEDPRILGSLSHCKISEQRLKSRDWPSQSSTWCLFVNLIMKSQEVGWNRSHHAVLLDHVKDTYLQNQPPSFLRGVPFVKLPQAGATCNFRARRDFAVGCSGSVTLARVCRWQGTTRAWRSSSPWGGRWASTWWVSTPQPCSSWFCPGCPSGSTPTPVLPECPWVTCSSLSRGVASALHLYRNDCIILKLYQMMLRQWVLELMATFFLCFSDFLQSLTLN